MPDKGVSVKLQAQQILCQRQIEVNTGTASGTCHSPAIVTALHVLRSLKEPSGALQVVEQHSSADSIPSARAQAGRAFFLTNRVD